MFDLEFERKQDVGEKKQNQENTNLQSSLFLGPKAMC